MQFDLEILFGFFDENYPDTCHLTSSHPNLFPLQMVRFYASADAFVMPTRGEGWGLPIIQVCCRFKHTFVAYVGGTPGAPYNSLGGKYAKCPDKNTLLRKLPTTLKTDAFFSFHFHCRFSPPSLCCPLQEPFFPSFGKEVWCG